MHEGFWSQGLKLRCSFSLRTGDSKPKKCCANICEILKMPGEELQELVHVSFHILCGGPRSLRSAGVYV